MAPARLATTSVRLVVLSVPLVLAAVPDVRAEAAEPGSVPPAALSLEEALRRLDSQNLTLAQARSRAQEARAVVRQAMAAFLPVATAGGSYTRNNAEARLPIGAMLDAVQPGLRERLGVPEVTTIQPLESFTGAAAVRVPLFAGNAYWDWSASREMAKAAEESVETVRLQLRGALLQAAWWAAASEDIADASARALTVAREHEQSAARAVQAGTSPPLAHLQAQTEVVRRESDLARARAERDRAWLAVGVLLGKAEPARIAMPEAPPDEPQQDRPDALARAALGRRPELRAWQASVHAAELQRDSAWWRLAPQLSASFSALASSVDLVTGDNGAWKATVDLSWTLYDGGLRYGRRAQAEAQVAAGRAALEAQQVEISQQVKDAAREVEVAREQVRLAGRQQALAREVYASARRSFDAGLASSLDVLDANDRLYQAEVAVANARARLGMAQAGIQRATGSLL